MLNLFLLTCAIVTADGTSRSPEVKVINGTPTLLIDGQPHNPLIYFAGPHRTTDAAAVGASSALSADAWQTQRPRGVHTIELAAHQGIHIHSFSVWMPWTKADQPPDFSDVDATIAAVLARDPEGLLIPRFDLDAPAWWRKEHPDQLMLWSTDLGLSSHVDHPHYSHEGTHVSPASALWREEAGQNLERFVAHLESRFGNRIIGYHLAGQNTHEWFYIDCWTPKMNCCEPAFVESWRRWLLRCHGSQEAIGRAWSDANLNLADIHAPTREERLGADVGLFRDPGKSQRLIDFHQYQNEAVVEAIEHFARIAKRTSHKLVLTFYGYEFELARIMYGIQQSGHLALGRLLECPDVDIICSPVSYFDRGAGGIGAYMSTVDSAALHRKMWCNEDDTRTFLIPPAPQKQQAGGEWTKTPQETRGVHQRNFAHLLPRRNTCWWMDLGGLGCLDDEAIWQDLGQLRRIYDQALGVPSSFHPEIAVIVDEKSNYYLTQKPNPLLGRLLYEMRGALYRIGAPCGYYLLADLAAGKVPPAKMYLFLNCFALGDPERDAMARHCAGKTRVFFYANGFINASADVRNMEQLLQSPMKISLEPTAARLDAAEHALFHAVNDCGTLDRVTPVFFLDVQRSKNDPALEILAHYRGSAMPAAWVRRESGSTYYFGTLLVPAKLLRNLAKAAGVHIYCDSDDVIEADGQFLAIHAGSSGVKRLVLPGPADVDDAIRGAKLGSKLRSWTEKLERGETRLYNLRYE